MSHTSEGFLTLEEFSEEYPMKNHSSRVFGTPPEEWPPGVTPPTLHPPTQEGDEEDSEDT